VVHVAGVDMEVGTRQWQRHNFIVTIRSREMERRLT
jgi:hypothetical protein